MISHGAQPEKRRKVRMERAETRLLGLFESLVDDETPGAGLFDFAKHVGMTLPTKGDADRVWAVFLAHYLSEMNANGRIDEDRVAHDLAAFPPIARRVAEINRAA